VKNVADIYALSPMQELMLLHAKTAARGQDALFNQIVYTIAGPLDITAYRRAWELMVDRHPALRTIFVWQDGKEPLQVVREEAALPWSECDWREMSAAAQARELEKLLVADRAAGFDLMRAPLIRLTLVHLANDQYWLIWSSHHLIIDRWCIGILFEELMVAYSAFAAQAFPDLLPAPSYSAYIVWLKKQSADAAEAYWRKTLHGVTARPLPLQNPSGEVVNPTASIELSLSGNDWSGLRQFALENDLTTGALVSGAWAILLSMATNAQEVIFGLTVSGRPAEVPDVGKVVGCFINNAPLRVRLDEEAPFVAWLQGIQDSQLEIQPFEYASPAQIQTWSGLHSRGPLFDTLVVLQAPVRLAMPAGLSARYERGGMQTGYPISLGVVPEQESLQLTLTYDRERVPEKLVEQIGVALPRLLRVMPKAQGGLATLRTVAQIDAPAGSAAETLRKGMSGKKRPFIPPQTALERLLAQIWAEVLNLPQVSIGDKFFTLGGDSIKAIRLFTQIEKRLGKKVNVSLMLRNPTVAEMAAAVDVDTDVVPEEPILLPINKSGDRPPFFYVHGVFGDVLSLTNLVPYLGADQPLYGLQALGLWPGYEPDRTIEAMAARYVAAMRRIQPAGPYYLGGFCFGGIVAYEIARQLEQLGEKTALLVIMEGFAPPAFHNNRPIYHPQRLQIIQYSAPYWLRGYKEFGGWRIRERLRSKFGGASRARQSVMNPITGNEEFDNLADFNATRPEIQFRLREINSRAADAYVPQPFGGQVTLMRARCLRIGHALVGKIDPESGWGNLAQGGVSVRYVAGTHVSMLLQPDVADLAMHLAQVLQEAQEHHSSGE
jgi:thioesterase domain-containing protein/acyl carrier protein